MLNHVHTSLNEAKQALETLLENEKTVQKIGDAANTLISALKTDGHIFSCGNGGSMSDAMHFAEELSGRYRNNRKALPGLAISDAGHLSCVANDFGYAFVFSRFLEAHGRPSDCLLAISTSGTSENVINAAKYAKQIGMQVIALTGKEQSELGKIASIDICTPAGTYADRVQELHIKVIHILIELIEREFFPENY